MRNKKLGGMPLWCNRARLLSLGICALCFFFGFAARSPIVMLQLSFKKVGQNLTSPTASQAIGMTQQYGPMFGTGSQTFVTQQTDNISRTQPTAREQSLLLVPMPAALQPVSMPRTNASAPPPQDNLSGERDGLLIPVRSLPLPTAVPIVGGASKDKVSAKPAGSTEKFCDQSMEYHLSFLIYCVKGKQKKADLTKTKDCRVCTRIENFVWCVAPNATSRERKLAGECVSNDHVPVDNERGNALGIQCLSRPDECPTFPGSHNLSPSRTKKVYSLSRYAPLVSIKHKFIFCPVPKVANSQFKRLFLRLQGRPNFLVRGVNENFVTLGRFSQSNIVQIMSDPNWIKAVFVRDPLERLLSGWLQRCLHDTKPEGNMHDCASQKNHSRLATFEEFVDQLVLGEKVNHHFRRQSSECNLKDWISFYHFQGNFSHLKTHTKYLLQALDLFDEYGRAWHDNSWASSETYFSGNSSTTNTAFLQSDTGHDIFAVNVETHKTDAQSKVSQYFTKDVADKGLRYFKEDYMLFKLRIPQWYLNLFGKPPEGLRFDL